MYSIAGILVDMNPRARVWAEACEPYRCARGSADVCIDITDDMLSYTRELLPRASEAMVESVCAHRVFCASLMRFDALMMHTSAVTLNDYAYLFTAPSGVGKSTHARLWQALFNAAIINDDKPVLRRIDGRFYAFGTPWSGKDWINLNASALVRSICYISRADVNAIRPMRADARLRLLLNQFYQPREAYGLDDWFSLFNELISGVYTYELSCLPDEDAARVARAVMERA